jgi:hypothetical protein
MADEKKSPYCPRVVSENDIPVPKSLSLTAQTCRVGIPRPMPGIVILVHGVNDVGEAYQNQEKGIIAGLNKRLNRTDMYAHEWNHFIMTHNEEAQKKMAPGRSPVIPFYWGYKPVTHEEYRADQHAIAMKSASSRRRHICRSTLTRRMMRRKKDLGNDGQGAFKYQNDNFGNALDVNYAKGGGTFANATTNIPDMLGPGAGIRNVRCRDYNVACE